MKLNSSAHSSHAHPSPRGTTVISSRSSWPSRLLTSHNDHKDKGLFPGCPCLPNLETPERHTLRLSCNNYTPAFSPIPIDNSRALPWIVCSPTSPRPSLLMRR